MKSLNETTQLVRDEHKKLRGLFRQLEVIKSRSPAMVIPVLEETCAEIQLYLELEEKLLFLAVHRVTKDRAHHVETPETEFVHQAMSDHRDIAQVLREIRGVLQSGQPLPLASDWSDRIDELIGLTEAYLNGEEQKLLAFIEKHLPRMDASLSMQWFDLMDQVRARIHATTPADPAHAQNPNGGEQRRKTAV